MQAIKRTFGFILGHPLGKRHLVKAFTRFFWWQIQLRFSSSPFIVKTFIKPIKFYASRGLTGITGNIYSGLHEFTDMMFLLHFLRADDAFFDVGANVGSYTLLASGICGANSITLEPVGLTFDILSKNIALNNLQNKVQLINAGAGATAGHIKFSTDEDTTNHVIADNETSNSVTIPLITIDSLLTQKQPALIKIDVEGFETEVMKGMTDTLNSPVLKAIIIELNGSGTRYGFDESKIHDLLLSKDFGAFYYDVFKRTLIPMASYSNHNTIYCRDTDFINSRIKNAPGIKIMGEVI